MGWPQSGRRTKEFEDTALVHLDALYRGALRLTRNRAQAEDLVQEALLRAFGSFDRFTLGTNCRAWLFRIMRNVLLNSLRGERETPDDGIVLDGVSRGLEGYEVIGTPEEEFFQSLVHGDIERALRGLPEQFREVVVLADLEGFSYKEIAQALDRPIGTVMSRLHRGRRLLRGTLAGFARERGYLKE